MTKKFGFELLMQQCINDVRSELSYLFAEAPGDSEIERILISGVKARVVTNHCEFNKLVMATDDQFAEIRADKTWSPLHLVATRQSITVFGRVDFIFRCFGPHDKQWHSLIVECDGHDFHERTKEQASRDKSRDRAAVMKGYDCFRFTGSEIWRDPMGCADQIIQWAVNHWCR